MAEKLHATAFGFVRTVSKEPWHWEFDEPKAQFALAAGTFEDFHGDSLK